MKSGTACTVCIMEWTAHLAALSTAKVFLEGLRSRGRRQLRLRTGLLKALRDIAQRTVALVPLAMSYELLPDDDSKLNMTQNDPDMTL